MSTRPSFLAVLLGLALFSGAAALAAPLPQEEGSTTFEMAGTTKAAVEKFLERLKAAVADDDTKTASVLVNYPLRAWTGKKTVQVKDPKTFIRLYPDIFTADVKKSVAKASIDKVFVNSQGVMFDNGRVWIAVVEGKLGIITVNPPPDAPEEGK